MRPILPLAMFAAMAISVPAIAAPTLIRAGDAFMIGGGQTAPIAIKGRNVGRLPVEISADVDGMRVFLHNVAPGKSFEQVLGSGQTGVFRNPAKTGRAAVQFDLTDQVKDLEMRYQLAKAK